MKYTFHLKKNIHMYCHLLTISDEKNTYEAFVESAPRQKEIIIIWLEVFHFPSQEINVIKEELQSYLASQNIDCIFDDGKRI